MSQDSFPIFIIESVKNPACINQLLNHKTDRKINNLRLSTLVFVTQNFLTYCEKKNVLVIKKFEAEGRQVAKSLRSLEQFVRTVKDQNNFWQQNVF